MEKKSSCALAAGFRIWVNGRKALNQVDFLVQGQGSHVVPLDARSPGMVAFRAFKERYGSRGHGTFPGISVLAGEQAAEPIATEMGAMHQVASQHIRPP